MISKIFSFSTYTFEELICECISATYIFSFSISIVLGPVFSEIFLQFLTFANTSSVLCFFGIFFFILHFHNTKENFEVITNNNILETAPAEEHVQICHSPIISSIDSHPKSNSKIYIQEPVPEPPFELSHSKREVPDSYDFNYLSIQAGYTIEKDFNSLKIEKFTDGEPSAISANKTLQQKHYIDMEDTIEEQKIEESLNEINEEELQPTNANSVKIEKNEKTEESFKSKYKLPVFKEVKVDEYHVEENSDEEKSQAISDGESSYHSSKEIVNQLSNLFPENNT